MKLPSGQTIDQVQTEVERQLQTLAGKWQNVLSTKVFIDPNLKRNDLVVLRMPKKEKEYILLCMTLWYLPRDLQGIVRVELESKLPRLSMENRQTAHICLSSKAAMLEYILCSNYFNSPRTLFGWILQEHHIEKYKFFVLRSKRPKPLVYRRGYKDKGSMTLLHNQHEAKFDYSFTEEQNRIEEQRQTEKDTLDFLRGFLGEV